MKNLLKPALLFTFFAFCLGLNAADYSSVIDGEFHDPASWDCGCVPGLIDNIKISHKITGNVNVFVNDVYIDSTGQFYMQLNPIIILGDLWVETGGEIRNFRNMDVFGDYHMDGTHTGSSTIRIRGAENIISGTGIIHNPGDFIFKDGDKVISSSTILQKKSGLVQFLNAVTVENEGQMKVRDLEGGEFRNWINKSGSLLEITGSVGSDFVLDASAPDNTVKYSKIGASDQDVVVPLDGAYYNLIITGNNISGVKYLTGDTKILGDLTIIQNTLETDNIDGNYDLTVYGDWLNISGQFEANNNTINFAGYDQTIIHGGGLESFHNMVISDTTSLVSDVDLYSSGSMTNYGSLELVNKEFYLVGDWTNQGSADLTGTTVDLIGSTKQYISGDNTFDYLKMSNPDTVYNVSGTITIQTEFLSSTGDFFTNDSMLISSGPTGSARVGRTDGGVWGNVIVQRYMNPTVLSWHTLGSPVKGATLQSWNDDFITSGFPGSNYPTYYNNIQTYDETQLGWKDIGLTPAKNITDPVPVGTGVRAYIAAGAKVIDVTGPLHTGSFTFGVSFTNTFSPLDDGWVLLSNPYASTIDWDDGSGWTRFGLNNAIYVWNPDVQQYTSYISGVGINGGSPYIPHTQAFWVQTNNVAANLVVNENAKTITPGTFRNDENINPDYFRLKIIDESNHIDETVLRVDDNATPEFDPSFDAHKFYSSNNTVPAISTLTNEGADLSINTFPSIANEASIFVKIKVASDGTYNISAEGLDNFVESACLVLEDLENNTITDLKNDILEVDLIAGDYPDRFILHLSKPIEVEVVDLVCATSLEGKMLVKGFGSIPWDVKVFDEEDQLVFGGEIYSATWIENLASGIYTVEIANSGGSYCSEAYRKVFIDGPDTIELETTLEHITCGASANGSIKFDIRGGIAPYTIEVNGEPVEGNLTGLAAGSYEVTIIDANGCSLTRLVRISTVENIEAEFKTDVVFNQRGGGIAKFQNLSTNYGNMHWDFGDGTESTSMHPTHSYLSAGTYIVTLTVTTDNCEKIVSHEVTIEGTDSNSGSTRTLVSKRNESIQITILDSFESPQWLTGYNAVGQVVVAKQMLNPEQTEYLVPVGNFHGLMLIVIENPVTGDRFVQKMTF